MSPEKRIDYIWSFWKTKEEIAKKRQEKQKSSKTAVF